MTAKGGTPSVLSAEAQSFFYEGIELVFFKWTALQLAVQNGWGGRYSRRIADLAVEDVFKWFTRSQEKSYEGDLVEILRQALDSLNTDAADGSKQQVAKTLTIIYEECVNGNYQSIERMRSQATTHANVVQSVNENDDDSSEDGDEKMGNDTTTDKIGNAAAHRSNSNTVGMQVDNELSSTQLADREDGWSIVSSKRSKRRRN